MSTYPRKYAVATAAGDHLKDLDWDTMVDAANGMNIAAGVTIQYPYSFIVRNVGGVYDAISGNGVLTYGGSSDVGGIDGDDCAAVVNAVIASSFSGGIYHGVTINFGVGLFSFTSPIIFLSGVTIKGVNFGYTIFELAADINLITAIGTHATHYAKIKIENIYLKGDGHTGNAIHFEYVTDVELDNVWINNFDGAGIYFKEAWTGLHNNVKIDSCGSVASSLASIHLIGGGDYTSNHVFTNAITAIWNYAGVSVGILGDTGVSACEFINLQCEGQVSNSYPSLILHGSNCNFVGNDFAYVVNAADLMVLYGDMNTFSGCNFRGTAGNIGVVHVYGTNNRVGITNCPFNYTTLTVAATSHTAHKIHDNPGLIHEAWGQIAKTTGDYVNTGVPNALADPDSCVITTSLESGFQVHPYGGNDGGFYVAITDLAGAPAVGSHWIMYYEKYRP
jgi:hypothetical protein